MYKNVLFISSDAPDYADIVNSVNYETLHFVYSNDTTYNDVLNFFYLHNSIISSIICKSYPSKYSIP